jgi:hypothetical protein
MSAIIIPDELATPWSQILVNWRSFGPYIMKRPLPFVMVYNDPSFTLCCTATHIKVGAHWLAENPTDLQVMGLLHEAIHDIRGDVQWLRRVMKEGVVHCPGGDLPFVMDFAQWTMDYIVNDNLMRMGGRVGPGWLYDIRIGTWIDDREAVYERVYINPPPPPGSDGNPIDPGEQPGEGDEQLAGADDPARGPLAAEVYRDADPHKFRGVNPGDMDRIIGTLNPTGVNWRKVVRMMIRMSMGGGRASWATRNTGALSLGLVLPGKVGLRAGTLVVAVDTSGSMSQDEINSGLAGIKEMLVQCNPKAIWLLEIDAAVHKATCIKRMADFKAMAKLKGGGGTDMREVMKWVGQQPNLKPDLVIVMTDGDTPYPSSVTCETVWVMTRPHARAPECAGRTVYMLGKGAR